MERKLSIESPTMNLHTVLEHAKKLEEMIEGVSERYALNLHGDIFSFGREIDLKLNSMAEIGDEDDLDDEDLGEDLDEGDDNEGDADAEESEKPQA